MADSHTSPHNAAEIPCPDCGGEGEYKRDGEWVDCEWCAGTGKLDNPELFKESDDE